jgi:multidrug resistance efflux pump
MDLRVAGPCTVLPLLNADVRAGVEGIIDEVYVDQGDAVRKGTPIAKLSDRDYLVELAKARAEKAAKQAQIKLLRAGSRPEQIAVARTQLGKAEELLKFARGNLERSAALVERKFVSEKDLDEARELVAGREKEVDEARDRLTLAQVTARPEEIELLEAELRRVQAQERYVEEQMKALMVVSPIDGVITTPKLKQRVGLNLKKGDPIAEVNAIKDVTVEIAVPETEIADIAVGQPISLKVRAYPRETFAGSVASIAPVVNTRADRPLERTVLVTTRLDNAAGLLKPEMTGNAKIHCGERQVLELIGRRLVRFIRVEFWSWW